MKVISSPDTMLAWSKEMRLSGRRIGFVPTMGAIHNGHLSLVHIAKQHCDAVVLSIFVNPMQFTEDEDYTKYPREFTSDILKAQLADVDVVFSPLLSDMYKTNFQTGVQFLGKSNFFYEAMFRPGHFNGVATVIIKLFNIVAPTIAIFGQKDAQQLWIIKQMVKDLNFDVQIIIAPIIRDADGLAMSSRNVYLSPEQRTHALLIHKILLHGIQIVKKGERNPKAVVEALQEIKNKVDDDHIYFDYIGIVEEETFLEPVLILNPDNTLLIIAARFKNDIRLLDNCFLSGRGFPMP